MSHFFKIDNLIKLLRWLGALSSVRGCKKSLRVGLKPVIQVCLLTLIGLRGLKWQAKPLRMTIKSTSQNNSWCKSRFWSSLNYTRNRPQQLHLSYKLRSPEYWKQCYTNYLKLAEYSSTTFMSSNIRWHMKKMLMRFNQHPYFQLNGLSAWQLTQKETKYRYQLEIRLNRSLRVAFSRKFSRLRTEIDNSNCN